MFIGKSHGHALGFSCAAASPATIVANIKVNSLILFIFNLFIGPLSFAVSLVEE
jgi:hypothetical protein